MSSIYQKLAASKIPFPPFKISDFTNYDFSKEEVDEAKSILKGYRDLLNKLNSYYETPIIDIELECISTIKKKVDKWIPQVSEIDLYIVMLKDINENENILKLIATASAENVDRHNLTKINAKQYYNTMILTILEDAELEDFSLIKHMQLQDRYNQLDEIYNTIAEAKVREIGYDNIPNHNNASRKSEIGILKSQKEKPNLYVKQLFEKIPNLLPRLKPVMLMSPLNVSTYLPSDIEFDLVIFDEASQIQVEDSICSIYRGKQIVVVGDSEQLPPTDFFQRVHLGEDDYDEDLVESGISLLDLCNTFLEKVELKWHYRSKNENLIKFSNEYIYNNELITFASPYEKRSNSGVEFYKVDNALYQRGGKRVNTKEAQKIVELIVEHINNYPTRSLGVIAFSIAQKHEILRLLDNHLLSLKKIDINKYNELYHWINNEESTEPFFVKNLENVQGDERDTIILSICYGKSKEDGQLLYNLGKLNRDEGKKRINVAITRSKINMKVVCSFDPEEMKVLTDDQVGLATLKQFLISSVVQLKKLSVSI